MAFDKNTLESTISTLYLQIFFNTLKDIGGQDLMRQLEASCPWLVQALEEKKNIKTIKLIRVINSIKSVAPPGIGLTLGFPPADHSS